MLVRIRCLSLAVCLLIVGIACGATVATAPITATGLDVLTAQLYAGLILLASLGGVAYLLRQATRRGL